MREDIKEILTTFFEQVENDTQGKRSIMMRRLSI